MRYLTKTSDVYRVDTLEEVEDLRTEMEESNKFSVASFTYTYKTVKAKGEIIDEYYQVVVKKNITDEKEPDRRLKVVYEVDNG